MLKLLTAFSAAVVLAGTAVAQTAAPATEAAPQSITPAPATPTATPAATKPAGKKTTKKKALKKTAKAGNTVATKTATKATARSALATTHKLVRVAFTPEKLSVGDLQGLQMTRDALALQSSAALVIDQSSLKVLFEKNSSVSLPMASITKLMTSLVVLEANQDLDEILEVTNADIDTEKGSSSRLRVGSRLTRSDMLHIALMSSENRAASSLGRHYPGGLPACVAAMNAKAKQLGMLDTYYVDSTGLSSHNVASAQDLAKLVAAAYDQPMIRRYSTDSRYAVSPGGRMLEYASSNRLISNADWQIGLQKTGYITEAGRCLVMQAMIDGRAIVMVFLDSKGKYSRFADAGRIRKWLESIHTTAVQTVVAQ